MSSGAESSLCRGRSIRPMRCSCCIGFQQRSRLRRTLASCLTIRGFWVVIIELWSYFRWQKTQYMRRKVASLAETPDIVGSREHQKPDMGLLTAKIFVQLYLLPLKFDVTSFVIR